MSVTIEREELEVPAGLVSYVRLITGTAGVVDDMVSAIFEVGYDSSPGCAAWASPGEIAPDNPPEPAYFAIDGIECTSVTFLVDNELVTYDRHDTWFTDQAIQNLLIDAANITDEEVAEELPDPQDEAEYAAEYEADRLRDEDFEQEGDDWYQQVYDR